MALSKKEEIPVCSEDGATNTLTVYKTSSGCADAVILIMPAMGVSADYYESLAVACVSSGWHAITSDFRGIGRSSVRASRTTQFGYKELVHYDWPAIVEAVRKRFPSEFFVHFGS